MLIVSAVYKRSTVSVFKAHGSAQASISDCVMETFSAIRTVSLLADLLPNYRHFYGFRIIAYVTMWFSSFYQV